MFYLFIRISITALVVDYRIILGIFKSGSDSIYRSLKTTFVFKTINRIVSSRPSFFRGLTIYSPENTARFLMLYLSLFALMFLVGIFFTFIKIPKSTVSFRGFISHPPYFVISLVVTQATYIFVAYFKRPFYSTSLLRHLWKLVFACLIILDITVYSRLVHPLVKPGYGGGVVSSATLIARDSESADLIGNATGIRFKDGSSEPVFIIHISDDAFYFTTKYEHNFSSSHDYKDLIVTDKVSRVNKDRISGYVIQGFK